MSVYIVDIFDWFRWSRAFTERQPQPRGSQR